MALLKAEESLALATAVAVGSGSLKPARARAIQQAWLRIIGHETPPVRGGLPPGIGVRIVKPKGGGGGGQL